ncbi:hypothetical protein B0I72DRAFT_156216 [Yarrowia lipolytica]|uniref:YALI0A01716p n=2 Tax=Yarrowia lipolytica TaxID=4952 RepID=Q6CI50_YARLI|nr:YALI0A01716p [Yarrowia lipolytica CLIB122]RDW25057.1 hypothetical protein B0I71DRAFT_147593 [Yarrowia lipolytica]RDW35386.1 hypothetical protein B0I72DRAFT_156216 [Yarrowia lipolytica]RDW39704.1 hypothetical protein B0I73DRAFT_159140 [Yarrowia lipolytica]RDW45623.1 hypothetical protein B0I74DRAFT_158750 [Yarrowia lipolytica]RDW51502.1 hypothetical protein B0I75DRAFT_85751 [Yarrowia lipolytica]|eukprot:XP_499661.1 YALI0A01716p [Yarrowia lipolytica CLIB122]
MAQIRLKSTPMSPKSRHAPKLTTQELFMAAERRRVLWIKSDDQGAGAGKVVKRSSRREKRLDLEKLSKTGLIETHVEELGAFDRGSENVTGEPPLGTMRTKQQEKDTSIIAEHNVSKFALGHTTDTSVGEGADPSTDTIGGTVKVKIEEDTNLDTITTAEINRESALLTSKVAAKRLVAVDYNHVPFFPEEGALAKTFLKEDGHSRQFFIVTPWSEASVRIDTNLRSLIASAGGVVVDEPNKDTFNITYDQNTVIPESYSCFNNWYTPDLVFRCTDCMSFDEDIVSSEIIGAPNFDSKQKKETGAVCTDLPTLEWDSDDLCEPRHLLPLLGTSDRRVKRLQKRLPLCDWNQSRKRSKNSPDQAMATMERRVDYPWTNEYTTQTFERDLPRNREIWNYHRYNDDINDLLGVVSKANTRKDVIKVYDSYCGKLDKVVTFLHKTEALDEKMRLERLKADEEAWSENDDVYLKSDNSQLLQKFTRRQIIRRRKFLKTKKQAKYVEDWVDKYGCYFGGKATSTSSQNR